MDISIIVPLYKGKKYIPHIVEMVKENQQILIKNGITADIEIIFINDFPNEKIDTEDFAEFSEISIRFYDNSQNFGIHKTRTRGLQIAKGIYITFLDQDDEITPFYFLRQLKYIGESDAVLCNGIYRGNKIIYRNMEQQRQAICKDNFIKTENIIISPGQMLIKREAIPNLWLKHILKKNGIDDFFLWTLMLCQGKSFSVNPYSDYVHKEDGKNTSLNFEGMKQSVEELLDIIRQEKLLKQKDFILFEKGLISKIQKYEGYICILDHWEQILKNITELAVLNNYKKLAIYGNGIIGKKLFYDLEDLGMKPLFVIDRDARNFKNSPYPVYAYENLSEEVDVIIITPLFAEKEIKKILKNYSAKIVSLGIDL